MMTFYGIIKLSVKGYDEIDTDKLKYFNSMNRKVLYII
jgi:hypothetical protein